MSHAQGTSPTGISWPTGIKLDKTSLTLKVGQSEQLTATVQPGNAPQDVEWWVESNDDVVTVSESGLVYAKAVGTATVMVASTHDISIYTACNVTVIPEEIPAEDTDISKLDNVIYLEKTEVRPKSTVPLSFRMKNSAKITGFQFDLYLPDGVTAVKSNSGRIRGALSDGRRGQDDEHTLLVLEQDDGAIRFLCEILDTLAFTGTEGEIATLQIKVDEKMECGDYPIVIKNMKLTESDIKKFYETKYLKSTLVVSSLGDATGDGKVDISDYRGVANHILRIAQSGFNAAAADIDKNDTIDILDYRGIANFILTQSFYGNKSNLRKTKSMANGSEDNYIYIPQTEFQKKESTEEEVTLSFNMKNTAAICGFQFDLYLPEGFSVVKKSSGKIDSKLTDARRPEDDDDRTLKAETQEDGAIRFLCGTLDTLCFTGNDGGLLTLKVKLAADLTSGEYPITLKEMTLTEVDIRKSYKTAYQEYTVKVTETTGIRGINVSSKDEVIYDLSGRRTNKPQQKGIYIVDGKKVVIK